MTARPPLEWRNKPVEELTREELIELVGVLNNLVWESAENFEHLLSQAFPHTTTAGRA